MKYRVKITVLSFLVLILSVLNLNHGISYNVTDNTEHHALHYETKAEIKRLDSALKPRKIISLDVIKNATASFATKTSRENFDFSGVESKKVNCNQSMPNVAPINYCHYMGSDSFFVYGHNTSAFSNLDKVGQGSIITLKLDGKIRRFRAINNFTFNIDSLSGDTAAYFRTQLYTSTYGGKYDLTIQTCAGQNNETRRFIQAIEI